MGVLALTDRELENAYLQALPDMMENPRVWEAIEDRSPELKDAFLFDRFKAAHQAYQHGVSFDDWHEEAKRRGIEPLLAQRIWDRYRWPFREVTRCQ
jgi:hypothetical protein